MAQLPKTDLPNSEMNNFGSQIINNINADGDNANDVDAKSPVQQGKVWQSICDEFNAICPDTCRSDRAIRKRWDKLLEDYKRVQDNNLIDDPVFNEVYENRRDMVERRVRRREMRNDGIELIREFTKRIVKRIGSIVT
ncbi:7904_t:CDS:2, partial [Paraglomus occultum]